MSKPLAQKIDLWKDQLEDAGIFTEEQMLELEDHLHQKIDDLLSSGENEDKAFSEASLALGHPIALGQAYSISNKNLLLKQIGLFFLIGFPIISLLLNLPKIIYNMSTLFLIEAGFRSVSLGIVTTLILLPILGFYLWYFIKQPFGLVQLPKKIVRTGWKGIFILMCLLTFSLFASHFAFHSWIDIHAGISPLDYIHFAFTKFDLPFWMISEWGLIAISIILILSICMDALLKTGIPKNTWNKVAMLGILLGYFFFEFIGSYATHFYFYTLQDIAPFEDFLKYKELGSYIMILALALPSLFWGKSFFNKQKYFVAHG